MRLARATTAHAVIDHEAIVNSGPAGCALEIGPYTGPLPTEPGASSGEKGHFEIHRLATSVRRQSRKALGLVHRLQVRRTGKDD